MGGRKLGDVEVLEAQVGGSPLAARVAVACLPRCSSKGCKRRATLRHRVIGRRWMLCRGCAPVVFARPDAALEPVPGAESIERLETLAAAPIFGGELATA